MTHFRAFITCDLLPNLGLKNNCPRLGLRVLFEVEITAVSLDG